MATLNSKPSPWRRRATWSAIAVGAALALSGCSLQIPSLRHPAPSASPSAAPTAVPVLPTTAPGVSSAYNPVAAAQALLPSVGMVIVNVPGGESIGSGFVIQSSGNTSYMVTNNHVVTGGQRVQVLMQDGSHWLVQVQGTDPIEDIAVLKIPASLPVAQFGDSTQLQVGEPVVAIGSPLANQGSVTAGIISALHRTLSAVANGSGGAEDLPDVLQTDAPINPGNSGGPLADAAGHVVGMNTANASSANSIGYAIPSVIVKRIAQDLIDGKQAGHPYVGVCFETIDQALAASSNPPSGYGAVVTGTVPGTPAATAGLQVGDVIEKVGSTPLNNGQTLGGALQLHNPGDTVQLTVLRSGSAITLSLTLAQRPASGGGSCQP
ncbi:MAG TPA: trypsin-like peptidase domain-containing protein [Candidatus Nitrosotalea sp.]|nr:trypsin-like peptidase domain-containing protein [Candidatus Nitrosotalea sp.]